MILTTSTTISMNNNQVYSCHTQDNVSDDISMQPTDTYNLINKGKYEYSTSDNHHAIINSNNYNQLPNTNNTQTSSTLTVEQRRAGKQHHIRWSEQLHATAQSHTHQHLPAIGNL